MKKIIVGNWKMNPGSLKEAKKVFGDIKRVANKLTKIETVICPSFVHLAPLGNSVSKSKVSLGAQDLFWDDVRSSYTGEISSGMLKDLKVKYVIIGHSERREHLCETNGLINKKVKTALKNGFKVILCIGEKERDSERKYLRFIKEEITEGLKGIPRKFFSNLIIAYEPIWAVGKNAKGIDTPDNVFQMSIYIRRLLLPIVGKEVARKIPVLYGGSVDPSNAYDFLEENRVQGLLIGRQSLRPENFNKILKIASEIK